MESPGKTKHPFEVFLDSRPLFRSLYIPFRSNTCTFWFAICLLASAQSIPACLGLLTWQSPSDSSHDPPRTERDQPAQCTAQDEMHMSGARADEDQRVCVPMPSRQRRADLGQSCSSLHPLLGTLLGQKRLDLSEYLHVISAGHCRTQPE